MTEAAHPPGDPRGPVVLVERVDDDTFVVSASGVADVLTIDWDAIDDEDNAEAAPAALRALLARVEALPPLAYADGEPGDARAAAIAGLRERIFEREALPPADDDEALTAILLAADDRGSAAGRPQVTAGDLEILLRRAWDLLPAAARRGLFTAADGDRDAAAANLLDKPEYAAVAAWLGDTPAGDDSAAEPAGPTAPAA